MFLELMVFVEGLQDGGAPERVSGEDNIVDIHLPAEGWEVQLILIMGGRTFVGTSKTFLVYIQDWKYRVTIPFVCWHQKKVAF